MRKGWEWGRMFKAEEAPCAKDGAGSLRTEKEGKCSQNTGSKNHIK